MVSRFSPQVTSLPLIKLLRRFVFHGAAVITTGLFDLLFWIRESRPSQILKQQVTTARQLLTWDSLQIRNPDHIVSVRSFIYTALFRPLKLTFTEPIVFLVSLMSAIVFGLIYLFIEALPWVYGFYGFSKEQAALSTIPIGIGLLPGILTRIRDESIIAGCRQSSQTLEPEDKLTGFVIAAPVMDLSLWWFSWTVPPQGAQLHWVVSMAALIFVGFAANEFNSVLAGYLEDNYTLFSASAFASLSLFRSLFPAAFPIFAKQMYSKLGANYASCILATMATVFCVCPLIFLKYGKCLRESSRFACYSMEIYNENRVDADEDELDDIAELVS